MQFMPAMEEVQMMATQQDSSSKKNPEMTASILGTDVKIVQLFSRISEEPGDFMPGRLPFMIMCRMSPICSALLCTSNPYISGKSSGKAFPPAFDVRYVL